MKRFIALLVVLALELAPVASFAQQSSPGFVYGQVPSAAQWNSYFAGKLDYNANGLSILLGGTGATDRTSALTNLAGNATLGYYLRGDGVHVVLSQIQSSDVPGLAGGAVGSIPYQSSANTTAYLAGNTTTTPKFLTSTGTGSAALSPTYTSGTGTGSVVLSNSPTISSPTMTTATISAATITTSTYNGNTITAGTGTLNMGSGTITLGNGSLSLNGKNVTWNNSIAMSGTDSTTMTFPSTSATIARTDAAQTFTGTQTFSGTVTGAGVTSLLASPGAIGSTTASTVRGTTITATTSYNVGNMFVSATAPTVTACGGGCSVNSSNGTITMRFTMGSAPSNDFQIGLPAATTGWNCWAQDLTTINNDWMLKQVSTSTTVVTMRNFSAGSATSLIAGDVIMAHCFAY